MIKQILMLWFTCIMLISCSSDNTDTPTFEPVEKSDLFKLSMNERLNFGNLDVSGANKTHSQPVTITNTGKFAMQVDLPKIGSKDLSITTADNFANPLRPGMSYNFMVNYAPKTFGDKSVQVDMSEYLHLPKNNIITGGAGEGIINTSDIYKATFINENNQEFDGVLKVDAKYSETTNPQISADTGKLIDFGDLGKNNVVTKDILLTNTGDGNAIISNIEIVSNNKIFTVLLPEDFKGHFQPGKQEGFQIQASTGELIGGASAQLVIGSNSVDSPYIIDLRVQGDKPDIDFGGSGGQTGGGQIGGTDDNGNELGDGEVSGSIDFDSNTIDFGLVSLNKPRLQKISFQNKNDSVFSIEDIKISGANLSINNEKTTCLNTSLHKGNTCEIYVQFTPTEAQQYSGLVQIYSRIDSGDIFSIDFTTMGEGIEPKLYVENEFNFGRVDLGNQSSKDLIIKNTGKDILKISDISLNIASNILGSEDIFTFEPAACIKDLKHNEECTLNFTFKPVEYGEVVASLNITSNDALLSHEVKISGIGSGSALLVDNEVEIGSVNKTVTHDLEVFNAGYDSITINSADFAINENFKVKNNLCSVIDSSKSCVVQVEFTPSNDGTVITDVLTIVFNDTNRYNVIFTGSGAHPVLELSVKNGEILDFGRVNVDATNSQTLYIHNIGNAPLLVSDFVIQDIHGHDEYSITNNTCLSEIQPDGICEIDIEVSPTHGGTINDKLSFTSNELNNNNYVINLTAEGIFSDYALNASSLNFGEKYIYPEQTYNKDISVTNTGTEPVNIKGATVINGFFEAVSHCSTLQASESCNINVKVTPNKAGEITDTLRVTTDVTSTPIKDVALRIKGLDRVFTISPVSLNFGSVPIGSASTTKSVTIRNTGNVNLAINSITATAPFTIASKTCGTSLAANATCNVLVKVTPNAAGANRGNLNIVTDALRESTKTVALSVTGTTSSYSISTTSLDFGTVEYGRESATKTITVTNTGSLPITFSTPTISAPYKIKSNTCKTLQVGAKCTIGVAVTADRVGTIGGTINIYSNAYIEGSKVINTATRANLILNESFDSNNSIPISKGKYRIITEGIFIGTGYYEAGCHETGSYFSPVRIESSQFTETKNDINKEVIFTQDDILKLNISCGSSSYCSGGYSCGTLSIEMID